jgi:hypothetical protein
MKKTELPFPKIDSSLLDDNAIIIGAGLVIAGLVGFVYLTNKGGEGPGKSDVITDIRNGRQALCHSKGGYCMNKECTRCDAHRKLVLIP